MNSALHPWHPARPSYPALFCTSSVVIPDKLRNSEVRLLMRLVSQNDLV